MPKPRKPLKPAARKPAPKGKAIGAPSRARAMDSTGRSFLSAYQSSARTDLMLPKPRDFRQDLTAGNRGEMQARMRYLERNFGLKRQIVADFVTYVVGHGRVPMSHAQDPAKRQLYVDFFLKRFARNCDTSGRFSYQDVQRLACRRKFTDGDFFIVPVKTEVGIKLQLIEAHRICSPYKPGEPRRALRDDGVNYDPFGRILSYTVQLDDGTYQDIDAANVIHYFSPEWSTGSRGLPRLQHAWADSQDLMELLALEKQATKLHSEFSVVLKNTAPGFLDAQAKEMQEPTTSTADLIQEVKGGKILAGPNGQDVDLKASQRPNANFVGYIEHLKRDVTMASIPYEFVGDASKLGSVGVRLIGSKASRVFAVEQEEMAQRVDNKVWAVVIGDAIARGELPEDPAWDDVSWTGPKDVTVDAGRDARNDREALASGLMSFTEYYRINSGDFEKETDTLAQNYRHLFDLERKYGLPEGLLASGLRKGLTFTPEEATVVDPEDVKPAAPSEPADQPDADTL